MKTFEITKEQIESLYNCDYLSEMKQDLKSMFPKAFESELLPNVWNYVVGSNCYLIFGNKKDNGGNYIGYGFDLYDNDYFEAPYRWIRDCQIKSTRPATDKEVETALIAEAKRRGFNKTIMITQTFDENKKMCIGFWDERSVKFERNKLFAKGVRIFDNGKWAEIISEPIEVTLEQRIERIEEQLKIKK